jgi:LacI family transcriptional regulator
LSLPKPVALFACDDYFASQITEICKIYNIAVPDEISVLGVDNDDLICSISDPPLSSIVLDVEKGGYHAASVLHQMMSKEMAHTCDIVISPLRIEMRKSTEKFAVSDKYVLQVIDYVNKNYAKHIFIADILQLVPLSRRVFEKRFKKETGVSIYQYVLNYKIEKFSQFIIKTDIPMVELALECGFEDYKNFSRIFQKFKGSTPLQYRKLHRQIEKKDFY